MTHRHTRTLSALVLAAAVAAPLHAQRGAAPPQGSPPVAGQRPAGPQGDRRPPGPPTLDDRVKRMTDDLGLSADQATKVRAVLAAEERGTDSLLAKRALEMEAERVAMEANRTKAQQALLAVLTPDQRTKALAMRARMHDRNRFGGGMGPRGGGRGGDGWRGGPMGPRGRGMVPDAPPMRDGRRGPPPGGDARDQREGSR